MFLELPPLGYRAVPAHGKRCVKATTCLGLAIILAPFVYGTVLPRLIPTKTGMVFVRAYLLGLLAMIKCSICSYQCDN